MGEVKGKTGLPAEQLRAEGLCIGDCGLDAAYPDGRCANCHEKHLFGDGEIELQAAGAEPETIAPAQTGASMPITRKALAADSMKKSDPFGIHRQAAELDKAAQEKKENERGDVDLSAAGGAPGEPAAETEERPETVGPPAEETQGNEEDLMKGKKKLMCRVDVSHGEAKVRGVCTKCYSYWHGYKDKPDGSPKAQAIAKAMLPATPGRVRGAAWRKEPTIGASAPKAEKVKVHAPPAQGMPTLAEIEKAIDEAGLDVAMALGRANKIHQGLTGEVHDAPALDASVREESMLQRLHRKCLAASLGARELRARCDALGAALNCE